MPHSLLSPTWDRGKLVYVLVTTPVIHITAEKASPVQYRQRSKPKRNQGATEQQEEEVQNQVK